MLWPRETPCRSGMRKPNRPWYEPFVGLALLLALVFGCVRISGLIASGGRTYDCRLIATCEQTLPECGPDVRVPAGGQPLWYWGRQEPRNAPALLGFAPLLPMRVSYPVSWDSALLAGPASAPGNVPLLREVYINWLALQHYQLDPIVSRPMPPTPTPAPAPPSREALYVLDETTATLDPLTGVEYGTGFEFAAQREVALGAVTGTLYYLAPLGGMPTPAPNPFLPTPTPTIQDHVTAHTTRTPILLTAIQATPSTAGAMPMPTAVPTDSYFALVLL